MNICLILIASGWGGAENVVYNLTKQLSKKGEQVYLILNNEIFNYFSDLKKVKIYRIDYLYNIKKIISSILFKKNTYFEKNDNESSIWQHGIFYSLSRFLRYLYYREIQKNILNILKQKKIDIVHLHRVNYLPFFKDIIKNLNIPVVLTLHGSLEWTSSTITARLFEKVKKKDLIKLDYITCVSKYVMNRFEYSGMPIRKKSIVIPNGVNVLEIKKISKMNLKGDFKLFFPGGAKSFKGGDLVIKSLSIIKKKIPGIHLYITGNIPKNNIIRKLIKSKKLDKNVTLLGFLEHKKNLEVFNSTDLLVFPSKSEGFSIVLLEAMALGKPIVTTNFGGIPELVKNKKNGIIVKRDPNSIAKAVIYLFKNKELCKNISLNNLNDVKKFDWEKIVDDYVELYKRCIKN